MPDGPPARFVSNRLYLARAAQLGFLHFQVANADAPIVCRDEQRTYVWTTLDKKTAVPASDDVHVVSSPAANPSKLRPKTDRRTPAMSKPSANGHADDPVVAQPTSNGDEPPQVSTGFGALIAEADSIKELLRDVYARSSRLVIALRRQRKQSKLVQTTLASLRQLQQIDG